MRVAAWGAAAVAVLVGVAVASWLLVGLLGLESWPTVLLTVVVGLVLLALVVVATPDVLGTLLGLRDAARPRQPDPELLERVRGLSIHEVRERADELERRATALAADGSAQDRQRGRAYAASGSTWRRLERAMREAGAFRVDELPEDDVERWGRRLHLFKDGLAWDPVTPLERPETQVRDVPLPPPSASRGRLLLRRWPGPRGRRR